MNRAAYIDRLRMCCSLASSDSKQWKLRGKKAPDKHLTSPRIPFSLWRWTVMSGLMKLLASMGMPMPRLADELNVKEGIEHQNLVVRMRNNISITSAAACTERASC